MPKTFFSFCVSISLILLIVGGLNIYIREVKIGKLKVDAIALDKMLNLEREKQKILFLYSSVVFKDSFVKLDSFSFGKLKKLDTLKNEIRKINDTIFQLDSIRYLRFSTGSLLDTISEQHFPKQDKSIKITMKRSGQASPCENFPIVTLVEIKAVTNSKSDASVKRAKQIKYFRVVIRVENELCGDITYQVHFEDPANKNVAIRSENIADEDRLSTYFMPLPRHGEKIFFVPVAHQKLSGTYTGLLIYKNDVRGRAITDVPLE